MGDDVSRKGSFLERLIARLFNRIGFETKLNSHEYGFESDIIAQKKGFSIIIETKQYEGYINIGALIDQWANRAKRTKVDRVLLVITGLKNIPEKYYTLAKQEGVYLWDENTVHNLNDIETKEKLFFQIGKKLEFNEIIEILEKKAKNILTIKLITIAMLAILIFFFVLNPINQKPINNPIDKNQPLLNFCKENFESLSSKTKIKEYNYFENYESASEYIEKRYPNENLTINKAKLFEKNYLNKAKFPIYIIEGDVEIQPSLVSSGLYVCDKTGIIK